jgi:DHA3 family macrolide efflux protein-like MFS transporter
MSKYELIEYRPNRWVKVDPEAGVVGRATPEEVDAWKKAQEDAWKTTQEDAWKTTQEDGRQVAHVEPPLPDVRGWVRPLAGLCRVTSTFAEHCSRTPPSPTPGIDLACVAGAEVRACAAGRVLRSGASEGGGRSLWIAHDHGLRTYYAQLASVAVMEGEVVQAGQQIAVTGDTYPTTGPHLHFAVLRNGAYVDPEPYLPAGEGKVETSQGNRPVGMKAFIIVWVGQLISMLGSGMTTFALTIWVFRETNRATNLALLGMFFMVPLLVMSPLVGVMVDRYNRKLMMMLSDLAAGVTTIVVLVLYVSGNLQIWHLYVNAAINGLFQGFQWPAYSAALALMVSKKDYVRVSSMLEIVGPASNIVAPILGGAIIGVGDAAGFDGLIPIMLIDIVTFVAAVGTLLFIHVPQPARTEEGRQAAGGFFAEAIYGFKYIFSRPPLLALQGVFLVGNLVSSIAAGTLMAPMLLARTGSNAWIYGASETVGAIGTVVGGVAVGAWGGFKRRIHGVLLGWVVTFVGILVMGLGRAEPAWMVGVWAVGILLSFVVVSLVNGSNQAIWMAKVPPDVQGRVFSTRRLIAWIAIPVGALIAGPMADYVMEPAMSEGGALAGTFGGLVGTGPGAGMSLLFIFAALIGLAFMLSMYFVPLVRNVEEVLPDHEGAVAPLPSPSP